MKYTRFEDLPVWRAGMDLAERVFRLTADKAFAFQGDLGNQLQRAGLSVPNNVAEGFERGTTKDLLSFLYYARGSAGEVRSMLILCDRMPRFRHLKSEISDLRCLAESISRQLRAWADKLQNSPIPGQRHLTDRTRQRDTDRQRREAFEAELDRIVRQGARGANGAAEETDGSTPSGQAKSAPG